MTAQNGLIPACELAEIQAAIEATFDTPVTLSRLTGVTDDGYGHKTGGAPTQVAACNALFANPKGPLLSEIASRIGAVMVWRVLLPLATDVATGDTITITSSGAAFTVHIVEAPQSYSPFTSVVVGKVV